MASIEKRNRSNTPPKWRVIWREGSGEKHSETFASPESAVEFKAFVEGNNTYK